MIKYFSGKSTFQSSLMIVNVAFVLLIALPGCSNPSKRSDRAVVSGSVTFNNKPVSGGIIRFVSSTNPATADGTLSSDGSYIIGDVPMGNVKVSVDPESIKPELGKRYVQIPSKYLKSETTPLTINVEPGNNTANFDLQ